MTEGKYKEEYEPRGDVEGVNPWVFYPQPQYSRTKLSYCKTCLQIAGQLLYALPTFASSTLTSLD
jgi:hypothetical protein